jgi:hypothetical protein
MFFDISLLFRCRLIVARLGERDLFHWGESNSLTDEGRYALGRLFRNTSVLAATALAIEAARARHEAVVPPGPHITLFSMGGEVEDAYESWLGGQKSEVIAETITIPRVSDDAHSSVGEIFTVLDVATEEMKPRAVGDRTIHLAQLTPDELPKDVDRFVRVLLAAYRRSEKDKFLAPYMTLCKSGCVTNLPLSAF